jgi:hypothetical protein
VSTFPLPTEPLAAATPETARAMVSVIVPVTERPEPLDELYRELAAPLRAEGREFEFIFVTEPWGRTLATGLATLAAEGEPVRALLTGQVVGETAQIKLGLSQCKGDIVVIHPAYRRVEAGALTTLIARVESGADVATARRWPRQDSWINRAQTRAFHRLIAGLGAGRIEDIGSGVRAARRDVLRAIPLYGDFSRFLPLAALREGYLVEEVSVPQHSRERRTRVYSPGVYLRRLIDVIGLVFLLRFTEKPLRFFGLTGALLTAAGGLILLVLAVQRLGGESLADRPLLLLGLLLLVLGVQSIALGLIGEIIVHLNASQRRTYRIAGRPPA